MCNALTVTKRKSAPLPERLCERIAYCAILLTVYEADYSVVVAQSEGADHRYYSTPEMQNILLQNVVGHAVRKAKNFAGGATDTIFSGCPVLINYSCSLALRRWRRLISSRIFLGKKPAGLFSGRESLLSVCFSVIHQPLGSIPRRFSSARPNSLSQLARLTPSLLASLSNCSFNSGTIRIWNGGAFPVPFCFLSRLITVDMCTPMALCFGSLGVHLNTCTSKNATPRSGGTHTGRLTTNDSNSIEVAMRNHTTHPQGRDSHNLNKYIWRFIALSTAQPRVIHIEAISEQEARQQSPDGCVMVFAARIRQEVHHA